VDLITSSRGFWHNHFPGTWTRWQPLHRRAEYAYHVLKMRLEFVSVAKLFVCRSLPLGLEEEVLLAYLEEANLVGVRPTCEGVAPSSMLDVIIVLVAEPILAFQDVDRVCVQPRINGSLLDLNDVLGHVTLVRILHRKRIYQARIASDPQHQTKNKRPNAEQEARQRLQGLAKDRHMHLRHQDYVGADAPSSPSRGHDRKRNAPQEIGERIQAVRGVVAASAKAQVEPSEVEVFPD